MSLRFNEAKKITPVKAFLGELTLTDRSLKIAAPVRIERFKRPEEEEEVKHDESKFLLTFMGILPKFISTFK